MSRLPRFAVGTVQPDVQSQLILWGLLDILDRSGIRIQRFASRACFQPLDAAATITGQSSRHLDSWLMTAQTCRESFLRSAAASDLSIIDGQFGDSTPVALDRADRDSFFGPAPNSDSISRSAVAASGGNLETLCRWLDLPRLAVLDATQLGDCRLPPRPQADGLLLDRVADAATLWRLQTSLEALWGIPVIAALDEAPALRATVAEVRPGFKPPRELYCEIGERMLRLLRPRHLMEIAERRDFPSRQATAHRQPTPPSGVRVAVAYDDAFNCYFQDTLDRFELHGAEVVDFSPLRDESLPPGTDIVYLGCGHPEAYADALSENQCMLLALREHACTGRRMYAEGGGLAYLCQQLDLGQRHVPMVGALPAIARRNPRPTPPQPIEMTLTADTWLGQRGARLRGYLNSQWLIEPTGGLRDYICSAANDSSAASAGNLIGRHQVCGSRVHLNFALQPELLNNFLTLQEELTPAPLVR